MLCGLPVRQRGEESSMDRDIRAAVQEELVTDPRIDADDIEVEIFNGEVSLNGTVPSQASARRRPWLRSGWLA